MLRIFFFILMTLVCVQIFAQVAVAPSVGNGEPDSPYQIRTLNNLYWITQNESVWDKHFVQMADIDASATSHWDSDGSGGYRGWLPIGNNRVKFTGFNNGNDYTIRNLYINRPGSDYVGFFGYAQNFFIETDRILVFNLGLIDVDITGRDQVGALCGFMRGWETGSSEDPTVHYAEINRCYSSGTVQGREEVGGLFGYFQRGYLTFSSSTCDVSGDESIGGICGRAGFYTIILDCFCIGSVTGTDTSGGFCGYAHNECEFSRCYSSGAVEADFAVGGFVGAEVNDCLAENCYWDTETSGVLLSALGTGITTSQMKTVGTYGVLWSINSLGSTWWMVNGETRPLLRSHRKTRIFTPHQLQLMGSDLDGDYQIMCDIDLSCIHNPADIWGTGAGEDALGGFVPIGNLPASAPFTGTLEGNGYNITNLHIRRPDITNQSFLGDTSGAEIYNLNLSAAFVRGYTYTGGLASQAEDESIFGSCSFSGAVQATWSFNGGLIAYLNSSSEVHYCFSEGQMNVTSWAGGLIGWVNNTTFVSNSYSRMAINGSSRVAGFAGGVSNSIVQNCYSTGRVFASGYPVGGFVADVSGGFTISDCFWDTQTSEQETSAGGAGVQGKLSFEMKSPATFLDAGWSFAGIWAMDGGINDGYPYLTATPDPVFAVSPASRNFGDVQINSQSLPELFTIQNNGVSPLIISSVELAGANADQFELHDINAYPLILGAGQNATIMVNFAPETTGAKTASIQVTDNTNAKVVQTIALSGNGIDLKIDEFPHIQTWEVSELRNGWALFNENDDAICWEYQTAAGNTNAVMRYNAFMAMDDWLISPALDLKAGISYTISYNYKCQDGDYPENMALAIGNMQNPLAMTTGLADHAGFVNTAYNSNSVAFSPAMDGLYFLGFHAYSPANSWAIYLDQIRVFSPQTQVNQGISSPEGSVAVDIPSIQVGDDIYDTAVFITGLDAGAVVDACVGYQSLVPGYPNTGLDISLRRGDFAGANIQITHNLGFVPAWLAYRTVPGGWSLLLAPEEEPFWTDELVFLDILGKADGDVEVALPLDAETLPVELSSFTVAPNSQNNSLVLTWVTQSETNLSGYYIYRNILADLASASNLNVFVPATNTALSHTYTHEDTELEGSGIHWYWLQSVDLDGSNHYFGPVSIAFEDPGQTPPVFPLETKLRMVYPNPFNPETTLSYSVKEAVEVELRIYNQRGQRVHDIRRKHVQPGVYDYVWFADNLSSGIYLFQFSSGRIRETRKILLLK